MTRHRPKAKTSARWWYYWHRQLGAFAALIFVLIAITGVLLNHTESLKLDESFVQSRSILSWYGVKDDELGTVSANGHYFSVLGDELYIDDQLIDLKVESLIAAVFSQGIYVLASQQSIFLLMDNELIETFTIGRGLKAGITSLGLTDSGKVVMKDVNGTLYSIDDDFLQWTITTSDQAIEWAKMATLPKVIEESIQSGRQSKAINIERLMLDLHSGRFFGQAGVWLYDIASLILLFLSMSGFYLWFRGQKKRFFNKSR